MAILLVSPDGMLGHAFARALGSSGEPVRAVSYPEIDLRDEGSIARSLAIRPRLVINCAAYTDVDGAETNELEANEVNGHGVGRLARACAASGAKLVHFGTDYVFGGEASTPYAVDAPIAPRTAYGRSKALGEAMLRGAGGAHLYVRTSWLYAPWGKNFVRTIAKAADARPELKVVNDQRGRPTSAEGLVKTTLALLEAGATGTFHATDEGECTWYELAALVVEARGAKARVLPCTSAEYPSKTPRPRYSVLDLSRTHALVGPGVGWRDAVRDVLGRLAPL